MCKRLQAGAVPTLNLPEKSIPSTSTTAPRRELVRHKTKPKQSYSNLDDFKKKIEKLKLTGWARSINENSVTFELWNEIFALPKLSVTIETSLNFSVSSFNWLLPDEHTFYKEHKRSMRDTTLSTLLSLLQQLLLCSGLPVKEPFNTIAVDPSNDCSGNVVCHTVPINVKKYDETGPLFQAKIFLRSDDCSILSHEDQCLNCKNKEQSLQKSLKTNDAKEATPVSSKAPLTATGKERLVATIQEQRVVRKQLEERVNQLESEIEKNSINVNEALEKAREHYGTIVIFLSQNQDSIPKTLKD